jgi:hypothetical protein
MRKKSGKLMDMISSPVKIIFFVIGGIFIGIAVLVLILGIFLFPLMDIPFLNINMFWMFVPMVSVFLLIGIGMIVMGLLSGKFVASSISSGMKLLNQDFIGSGFSGSQDYEKILSEGKISNAKVKVNFQKFNIRANGMPLNVINLEIRGKSLKLKTFNPHIARHFPEGKTVKVVEHKDLKGEVLPLAYLKKMKK